MFNSLVKNVAIGDGYSWNEAITVTICGMGIVFALLVVLVIVIKIFGAVMSSTGKAEKPPKAPQVPKAPKPVKVAAPAPAVASAPVSQEDDDIIAVIAAAVASMYEGTGKKPVIKSIRPALAGRSSWAQAGVFENTRAF